MLSQGMNKVLDAVCRSYGYRFGGYAERDGIGRYLAAYYDGDKTVTISALTPAYLVARMKAQPREWAEPPRPNREMRAQV